MEIYRILTKLGQNVIQILTHQRVSGFSEIRHIFHVTSRRVKTTEKFAIVQISSRISQEPIRISKKPDTLF